MPGSLWGPGFFVTDNPPPYYWPKHSRDIAINPILNTAPITTTTTKQMVHKTRPANDLHK